MHKDVYFRNCLEITECRRSITKKYIFSVITNNLFMHKGQGQVNIVEVLLDFSLTVKAATLIFISGFGSAISSAKEGKSSFIYNLVKSK